MKTLVTGGTGAVDRVDDATQALAGRDLTR